VKRFLLTVTVATVGLTILAASQTQAAGPSGSAFGHMRSMSGHSFKPNHRFDYRRYGYRHFSWSRYHWSNYYRRYCYWAPSYGWCFYEPSYSCYLPLSCFSQVYPEAATAVAPAISTSPSVVQQTTVVTVPPVPAAPAVSEPPPPPVPPMAPAPAAVQQTKVGSGLP
jgi:hypothetical protein